MNWFETSTARPFPRQQTETCADIEASKSSQQFGCFDTYFSIVGLVALHTDQIYDIGKFGGVFSICSQIFCFIMSCSMFRPKIVTHSKICSRLSPFRISPLLIHLYSIRQNCLFGVVVLISRHGRKSVEVEEFVRFHFRWLSYSASIAMWKWNIYFGNMSMYDRVKRTIDSMKRMFTVQCMQGIHSTDGILFMTNPIVISWNKILCPRNDRWFKNTSSKMLLVAFSR